MTDEIKRYMPQEKLVPKTRGPGDRYIGVMNEHPEGKWVRLEDVTTLRLNVANLQHQLQEARTQMIRPESWSDVMCRAFAYGHDGEEAAQMGERNPWDFEDEEAVDERWKRDRVDCVRQGLSAMYQWKLGDE